MAKIKYAEHNHGHEMTYAVFSAILGKEVNEENLTYNDVRIAVNCIRVGDKPLNRMEEVNPYDLDGTVKSITRLFANNAAGKGGIVTAATYKPPYQGISVDYTGMEPEPVEKPKPMGGFKRFLNSIFPSLFKDEKIRIEGQEAQYKDYCEKMKLFETMRNDSERLAQLTSDHVWGENLKRFNELGTNDPDFLTPEEIENDKIAQRMKAAKAPTREKVGFSQFSEYSSVSKTTSAVEPTLENELEDEFVF